MSRDSLGEFELLMLLAILRLGVDVYGVPIAEEIERRTGRSVARSAVYVGLRRLEKKGLVSSWMGEALPERGGKPRRYVRVEPEGIRLVRETQAGLQSMWRGVDLAGPGAG